MEGVTVNSSVNVPMYDHKWLSMLHIVAEIALVEDFYVNHASSSAMSSIPFTVLRYILFLSHHVQILLDDR